MVLPADKGKAALIMDTDDYVDKIRTILSDERVYKKLKRDPTHGYKDSLTGGPPHRPERPGQGLLVTVLRSVPNIQPSILAIWLTEDPESWQSIVPDH